MIHVLKTLPCYWERVAAGTKTFEVRRNDRDFQVGDTLELIWFDPESEENPAGAQTKRLMRRVTYILPGGQWGIEHGYVVMGLGETAP